MTDAHIHLDDIVGWEIVHDIFEAEETSTILALVGQHATAINEAAFGAYFSSLQRILGKSLILAVARMYETEKAYALRSIPAAFKYLEAHREDLQVHNRRAIIQATRKLGRDDRDLHNASDSALTLAVVHAFSSRFDALQAVAGAAIKTIRDKGIAHHERLNADVLPVATYAEIDELIDFAKDFVAMAGSGYTGISYQGADGRYSLTADAERSTVCLKRLLAAAGVSLAAEPPTGGR